MSVNQSEISGNAIDFKVLKRIFRFVYPYKLQFNLLIFLTIIVGVLSPLLPFLVQKTIDNEIKNGNLEGLFAMLIIMVSVLFVKSFIQYSHSYLSGWLGQSVIKDIRIALYRHIISLRLRFFDKTPIGRLVTRVIGDIETLSDVFTNGLASIVGDILQLLFILLLMFITEWRIALISLSTLPILLFSTYVFKEKIKVAFNQVRTAVANLNSFVQEHITGMSVVQIFNAEEGELDKFKEINNEHKKAHIKSVLYYSVYFPVAEIIGAVSIGLLVWFGASEVLASADRQGLFMNLTTNFFDSKVTPGLVIAFIMYINMFFRPIRMIADRFNTLQMGVVSSKRILDLLDSTDQIQDEGTIEKELFNGNVEFKNVWFAYNNEEYVLKNISFNVYKGQTIAFVGATGAGKSSIINLLTRLYAINKGEILIDNIPAEKYKLSFLRKNIGVVLQDVFLFSDTIAENIRLGDKSITDEQIWATAKLVGADKFIEKLPNNLYYNVMERGATLSVGQRQLISFVRAMIYNPQILVLDEATSSVDSETEEFIQNAIEKMMLGRTSIVIAHRLSTIQKADKIIVLDKGEIVEEGNHKNLISKKGFYFNYIEMQQKLYI